MPVIPICSQQKSRQEKSRQENTRRVANECVCDLLAKAHLGYPLLIPHEARDQAPAADRLSMAPRRAYGAPIILDLGALAPGQLGDVRRDPSRLVAGEQLGR